METLLVLYHFSLKGDREAFEYEYCQQKALQTQLSEQLGEMLVHSTSNAASYIIISKWPASDFYHWLQSPEHHAFVSLLDRFTSGATVERYVVVEGVR